MNSLDQCLRSFITKWQILGSYIRMQGTFVELLWAQVQKPWFKVNYLSNYLSHDGRWAQLAPNRIEQCGGT